MGDACSKQQKEPKNEEGTHTSSGDPVVTQPSQNTEFHNIGEHTGQTKSGKVKDKSKKESKSPKKYTKQSDGNKDANKSKITEQPGVDTQTKDSGVVQKTEFRDISESTVQSKITEQPGVDVRNKAAVNVVSSNNRSANSSVVAEANKQTTVQASSSRLSQTDVIDKDTGRSKSTLSACSTESLEKVNALEEEAKDAQAEQDVFKTKERNLQAKLDEAKGNEQASGDRIRKLEEELKDAKGNREEAEKKFEGKNKELEDARKELEKEKQQIENTTKEYTKMIHDMEDELKKAKQDANEERTTQQQDKDRLENELKDLRAKNEKKKNREEHKKKLAEEITMKDAQLKDLQKQVDEKKRIAYDLKLKEKDIKQLKKENEELYLRLSAMAGRKLTDNNPNIADLSDQNRPTKLGEIYSQIYDNEWTDAFSYLETCEGYQNAEKKCIDVLYQTIAIAYQLSLEKANSELEKLSHAVKDIGGGGHSANVKDFLKQMKDSRKKRVMPEDDLKQEYSSKIQKQLPNIPCDIDSSSDWDKYRNACLNICWLMAIQDPPVYLECGDESMKHGDALDKGRYKEYTQSGKFIDFPVWPAMYLHKGGSVLSKGVVQCTKTFSTSVRVSTTSGKQPLTKKQDMSKSLNISLSSHETDGTQL